jgi:hypothetical protein
MFSFWPVLKLGLADSTTDLTVRGLRDHLDAVAQRALFDAQYRDYPEVRPENPTPEDVLFYAAGLAAAA